MSVDKCRVSVSSLLLGVICGMADSCPGRRRSTHITTDYRFMNYWYDRKKAICLVYKHKSQEALDLVCMGSPIHLTGKISFWTRWLAWSMNGRSVKLLNVRRPLLPCSQAFTVHMLPCSHFQKYIKICMKKSKKICMGRWCDGTCSWKISSRTKLCARLLLNAHSREE